MSTSTPSPHLGASPPDTVGKLRSPLVVLLLSIVTLSIYALYWQYAMFKEMKHYSRRGMGGGLGLVFALLLSIVNVFMMPAEVGELYASESQPKPVSGLTGFWILLPIVGGLIWLWKVQGHLNKFWQAHGAVKE
jgi:Domain of unknown function (DUF4234)